MLTSIATQPQINAPLKPLQSNLLVKPHKPKNPLFFANPKTCNFHLKSFIPLPGLKATQTPRFILSASQPQQVVSEEKPETPAKKEKLGVLVKPMEKPRVVLKFIWMKKVIGIALNQVIPGHGTIPLSPYYFWPKEDAWERLKVLLEGKPWISKKQMHVLINQATDVIELWQETGYNL